MTRVELDEIPGALRHAAADDVDQLTEVDLEPVVLNTKRRDAGLQAGDLAVVVRAEYVDHTIEPTNKELVAVVGEIAREIGRIAVGLDQHPIAVVTHLGGPKPDRAVLLVDEAALARSSSIVSSTSPLSSIEAWEYHSSKQMSSRAKVARMFSRIWSLAKRPASTMSSGPSYFRASR